MPQLRDDPLSNDRRQGLKTAAAALMGLPLLGLGVGLGLSGCDGKGLNPLTPEAPKFNGVDITGAEYAKAIRLSSVNLGFLIERQAGASSGDLITSRTFHIPASGGFMLHERTDEARDYFVEDRECAMFGDSEEMVAKIAHYLAHPDERRTIAEAGYRRCQTSDYSIDHRARAILEKAADIRARANSG